MTTFLEEVANDLILKTKGDFKEIAIVFNNKRPADYLQKYISSQLGKPFWTPDFFTIQGFIKKITDGKVIDPSLQLLVLHQEFRKILANEGLKDRWSNPEEFFKIGNIILSDFNQIDFDLVDAQKVFLELREIAEIDAQFSTLSEEQVQFLKRFWGTFSNEQQMAKQEEFVKMWRRMPILYKHFHQKLSLMSGTTEGQMYRTAVSNMFENKHIKAYKKIVFVGFNALSQTEVKLFQHLQSENKAWFYFDTDTHYLNDPLQEAGLFMRANRDKYALKNELSNDRSFLHKPKQAFQIWEAKGQTIQSNVLSEALKKQLKAAAQDKNSNLFDSTKLSETAVILLDEKLILPTLQNIPLQIPHEGAKALPINVSMGLSIAQSSLFCYIQNWIAVQKYYEHSAKYGPYQVPNLLVQNYIWNTNSEVTPLKRDAFLNDMMLQQWFYVPHGTLQEIHPSAVPYFQAYTNGKAFLNGFEHILQSRYNKILEQELHSEIELSSLYKLIGAFEQFKEQVQQATHFELIHPEEDSILLYIELLNPLLNSLNISLEAKKFNGLQLIGLLESRSLDFKQLYFVGANEGILPKATQHQTFIPDSIRRAHSLPVSENQDAISAYMFYRLIQRAEQVHLIYNSHTDEQNSGELTRFMAQLKFELPYQFTDIAANYSTSTQNSVDIKIAKTPEINQILNQFLQDNPESKRTLSPSAFTTYLNCPLQFFFKYIASIKESKVLEEDVPANKIGDILHHSLYELYQPWIGKVIEEENILALMVQSEAIILKHFNLIIFNKETHNGKEIGNHLIIKKVIHTYIEKILNLDLNLVPFEIVALEEQVSRKFDFAIDNKAANILFKGAIDRVDQLDEHIRIVDYKTGSDVLEFKDVNAVFDEEANHLNKAFVQTMLYAWMYEQNTPDQMVEPNLYLVRNTTGNTVFNYKVKQLNVDTDKEETVIVNLSPDQFGFKEIKDEFKELVENKLKKLFDPISPFIQTSITTNCTYCDYKEVCGR